MRFAGEGAITDTCAATVGGAGSEFGAGAEPADTADTLEGCERGCICDCECARDATAASAYGVNCESGPNVASDCCGEHLIYSASRLSSVQLRASLGMCETAAQHCAIECECRCCHTGNTEGVSECALVDNRSSRAGAALVVNSVTRGEGRTEFSAQGLAVHAVPGICCCSAHWPRVRKRVRGADEPSNCWSRDVM